MELMEGCGAESCARALRRWGSKVSPKLFVAREYVLKHIRLKHAEKVEAQRERVRTPCQSYRCMVHGSVAVAVQEGARCISTC